MIVFAGLPVKITDAVFADHIKVERTALFCGRDAYATICAWHRCPGMIDLVTGPFRESLATKRSVRVELIKQGTAYPVA